MGTAFISTKIFKDYPCCHRQWKAESHCRFIHGYSRQFHFEFSCSHLSKEMWVVDFGGLKSVGDRLAYLFDHTFLVAEDDPQLGLFEDLDRKGVIQMRVLKDVSMEGTAEFVYRDINPIIGELTGGRAWISKVEVRENEKNSGIYIP